MAALVLAGTPLVSESSSSPNDLTSTMPLRKTRSCTKHKDSTGMKKPKPYQIFMQSVQQEEAKELEPSEGTRRKPAAYRVFLKSVQHVVPSTDQETASNTAMIAASKRRFLSLRRTLSKEHDERYKLLTVKSQDSSNMEKERGQKDDNHIKSPEVSPHNSPLRARNGKKDREKVMQRVTPPTHERARSPHSDRSNTSSEAMRSVRSPSSEYTMPRCHKQHKQLGTPIPLRRMRSPTSPSQSARHVRSPISPTSSVRPSSGNRSRTSHRSGKSRRSSRSHKRKSSRIPYDVYANYDDVEDDYAFFHEKNEHDASSSLLNHHHNNTIEGELQVGGLQQADSGSLACITEDGDSMGSLPGTSLINSGAVVPSSDNNGICATVACFGGNASNHNNTGRDGDGDYYTMLAVATGGVAQLLYNSWCGSLRVLQEGFHEDDDFDDTLGGDSSILTSKNTVTKKVEEEEEDNDDAFVVLRTSPPVLKPTIAASTASQRRRKMRDELELTNAKATSTEEASVVVATSQQETVRKEPVEHDIIVSPVPLVTSSPGEPAKDEDAAPGDDKKEPKPAAVMDALRYDNSHMNEPSVTQEGPYTDNRDNTDANGTKEEPVVDAPSIVNDNKSSDRKLEPDLDLPTIEHTESMWERNFRVFEQALSVVSGGMHSTSQRPIRSSTMQEQYDNEETVDEDDVFNRDQSDRSHCSTLSESTMDEEEIEAAAQEIEDDGQEALYEVDEEEHYDDELISMVVSESSLHLLGHRCTESKLCFLQEAVPVIEQDRKPTEGANQEGGAAFLWLSNNGEANATTMSQPVDPPLQIIHVPKQNSQVTTSVRPSKPVTPVLKTKSVTITQTRTPSPKAILASPSDVSSVTPIQNGPKPSSKTTEEDSSCAFTATKKRQKDIETKYDAPFPLSRKQEKKKWTARWYAGKPDVPRPKRQGWMPQFSRTDSSRIPSLPPDPVEEKLDVEPDTLRLTLSTSTSFGLNPPSNNCGATRQHISKGDRRALITPPQYYDNIQVFGEEKEGEGSAWNPFRFFGA